MKTSNISFFQNNISSILSSALDSLSNISRLLMIENKKTNNELVNLIHLEKEIKLNEAVLQSKKDELQILEKSMNKKENINTNYQEILEKYVQILFSNEMNINNSLNEIQEKENDLLLKEYIIEQIINSDILPVEVNGLKPIKSNPLLISSRSELNICGKKKKNLEKPEIIFRKNINDKNNCQLLSNFKSSKSYDNFNDPPRDNLLFDDEILKPKTNKIQKKINPKIQKDFINNTIQNTFDKNELKQTTAEDENKNDVNKFEENKNNQEILLNEYIQFKKVQFKENQINKEDDIKSIKSENQQLSEVSSIVSGSKGNNMQNSLEISPKKNEEIIELNKIEEFNENKPIYHLHTSPINNGKNNNENIEKENTNKYIHKSPSPKNSDLFKNLNIDKVKSNSNKLEKKNSKINEDLLNEESITKRFEEYVYGNNCKEENQKNSILLSPKLIEDKIQFTQNLSVQNKKLPFKQNINIGKLPHLKIEKNNSCINIKKTNRKNKTVPNKIKCSSHTIESGGRISLNTIKNNININAPKHIQGEKIKGQNNRRNNYKSRTLSGQNRNKKFSITLASTIELNKKSIDDEKESSQKMENIILQNQLLNNNDEILYRSNIFDNLEDNLIRNRKDDSTKREDTIFNNEIYRKKKNTIELSRNYFPKKVETMTMTIQPPKKYQYLYKIEKNQSQNSNYGKILTINPKKKKNHNKIKALPKNNLKILSPHDVKKQIKSTLSTLSINKESTVTLKSKSDHHFIINKQINRSHFSHSKDRENNFSFTIDKTSIISLSKSRSISKKSNTIEGEFNTRATSKNRLKRTENKIYLKQFLAKIIYIFNKKKIELYQQNIKKVIWYFSDGNARKVKDYIIQKRKRKKKFENFSQILYFQTIFTKFSNFLLYVEPIKLMINTVFVMYNNNIKTKIIRKARYHKEVTKSLKSKFKVNIFMQEKEKKEQRPNSTSQEKIRLRQEYNEQRKKEIEIMRKKQEERKRKKKEAEEKRKKEEEMQKVAENKKIEMLEKERADLINIEQLSEKQKKAENNIVGEQKEEKQKLFENKTMKYKQEKKQNQIEEKKNNDIKNQLEQEEKMIKIQKEQKIQEIQEIQEIKRKQEEQKIKEERDKLKKQLEEQKRKEENEKLQKQLEEQRKKQEQEKIQKLIEDQKKKEEQEKLQKIKEEQKEIQEQETLKKQLEEQERKRKQLEEERNKKEQQERLRKQLEEQKIKVEKEKIKKELEEKKKKEEQEKLRRQFEEQEKKRKREEQIKIELEKKRLEEEQKKKEEEELKIQQLKRELEEKKRKVEKEINTHEDIQQKELIHKKQNDKESDIPEKETGANLGDLLNDEERPQNANSEKQVIIKPQPPQNYSTAERLAILREKKLKEQEQKKRISESLMKKPENSINNSNSSITNNTSIIQKNEDKHSSEEKQNEQIKVLKIETNKMSSEESEEDDIENYQKSLTMLKEMADESKNMEENMKNLVDKMKNITSSPSINSDNQN